jgi:hypothetical protein
MEVERALLGELQRDHGSKNLAHGRDWPQRVVGSAIGTADQRLFRVCDHGGGGGGHAGAEHICGVLVETLPHRLTVPRHPIGAAVHEPTRG